MTKKDFIKKFPDVKVQKFETKTVLCRAEAQKLIREAMDSLGMGLIMMERSGRWITCFTSVKMKDALDKMVKGVKLIDPNTGNCGVIVSDKPFIMCGEYCIEVEFPENSGVYSCEYFID